MSLLSCMRLWPFRNVLSCQLVKCLINTIWNKHSFSHLLNIFFSFFILKIKFVARKWIKIALLWISWCLHFNDNTTKFTKNKNLPKKYSIVTQKFHSLIGLNGLNILISIEHFSVFISFWLSVGAFFFMYYRITN